MVITYIIYFILGILADLYIFFWLYVASMGVLRAKEEGKLNTILWGMSVPFIAFALAWDIINNVFVFSIIFWQLPREWTVTARLKKHVSKNTRRGRLARWFGWELLNAFDLTGNHLD